jgi:hypothetical protein
MGAAVRQDLAAVGGCRARTEAVAALSHDFAGLIGALHGAASLRHSAGLKGAHIREIAPPSQISPRRQWFGLRDPLIKQA